MARPWGKQRQAAETVVPEDGESSRKQAGVNEGKESRTGWVEMEGMLFSIDSEVYGQEGELSQGHHEFMWLIR